MENDDLLSPEKYPEVVAVTIWDEDQTQISCPGADLGNDCSPASGTLSVEVPFSYTVQTNSNIEDPTTILPMLEETLLHILYEKYLSEECALDRRLQIREILPRIRSRRQLQSVGLCSMPLDVHDTSGKFLCDSLQ